MAPDTAPNGDQDRVTDSAAKVMCRDCRQRGGTYRDPCQRCGAPFGYNDNTGRLAWLLRRFGSAEHDKLQPSPAQWDVAANLDGAGVRADGD